MFAPAWLWCAACWRWWRKCKIGFLSPYVCFFFFVYVFFSCFLCLFWSGLSFSSLLSSFGLVIFSTFFFFTYFLAVICSLFLYCYLLLLFFFFYVFLLRFVNYFLYSYLLFFYPSSPWFALSSAFALKSWNCGVIVIFSEYIFHFIG